MVLVAMGHAHFGARNGCALRFGRFAIWCPSVSASARQDASRRGPLHLRMKRSQASDESTVRCTPIEGLAGVHQIALPTPWGDMQVQVYLIEGTPLTLIDTGVKWPPSRSALEAALATLGLKISDIERIIVTHFHSDHVGQAQTIRDAGARLQVMAHQAEAGMIENLVTGREQRVEALIELFREYGVSPRLLHRLAEQERKWIREGPKLYQGTQVDVRLSDGDRIAFERFELQVIHAPGHSAGHIVLYEPDTGTLFTGDYIMGGEVPFTDIYFVSDAPQSGDALGRRERLRGLAEYLSSLQRLRGLALRTILPAHGGVLQQPHRSIDIASRFYEARVARVRRNLCNLTEQGSPVTAWELFKEAFPAADEDGLLRRRMATVIGALDVLEDRGTCITSRRPDGVLVHRYCEGQQV